MKKLLFPVLALVAALTVSCDKEQGTESPAAKATQKVTIEASYADTKTAYANDKTFSWLAGDKISVMEDLDGTVKFNEFTADAEGPATSFTGEISDGATLGKWAVYPTNLAPSVEGNTLSVTLPRVYYLDYDTDGAVSSDNPLSILPLVGQKQEDDSYKFSTAMGVVKFSFTNVPESAFYFNVSSNGEPLYGTFSADENGTIKMDNYVSDGGTYAYWVVSPKEDNTLDVYLPLPVGTLTAGMEVWLEDSGEAELFSITTAKDIEVVRNRVTELAPIEVPDLEPVTLDDVFGEYEIIAYDYNSESGYVFENLTIEPSDTEGDDAMITGSFLGHTIDAIYGVYDDETQQLIFPAYQYYEDSENGTQLVLVSFTWHEEDGSVYLDEFTDDGLVLQFTVPGSFSAIDNPAPGLVLIGPGEDDFSFIAWYAFIMGSRVEEGAEMSAAAPSTKASKVARNPFFDAKKIKATRANTVKVPFKAAGKTLLKEKFVKFGK